MWSFSGHYLCYSQCQNDDDPDPNFHVDSDPDPDPDFHQNDDVPHPDPTLSFTLVAKFQSQNCQLTMFYLSHQCQMCDNFQYFLQHIEMFLEKSLLCQNLVCLELIPIQIGRIRIDMLWMPDPDPAK